MEKDMREKVIKGLECCIGYGIEDTPGCEDCPYNDMGDTCERMEPLYEDAIALLKAQAEEIKALRQLVEWAEECGFGLDNILWREYVTEEELDSIDGYVEQMIYVARKAVNGNA